MHSENPDENWFLKPLSAPLDLNPYFRKNASEDNVLPMLDEGLTSTDDYAKKSRNKSNYEIFYRDFIDVMEKSEDNNHNVREIIRTKFSEMKIMVLKESNKKSIPTNANAIASFPTIEKIGNRKRIAPPSSPKSRKKRH